MLHTNKKQMICIHQGILMEPISQVGLQIGKPQIEQINLVTPIIILCKKLTI